MDKPAFVHPTAVVDEGARTGREHQDLALLPCLSQGRDRPEHHPGPERHGGQRVTIGDFCKIQNNVSLYEGVVLEDYVFCGPSMVFTNVTTPRCLFPRNTSEDYQPHSSSAAPPSAPTPPSCAASPCTKAPSWPPVRW